MDIQEYGNYQVRIITDLGDHQKNLMHMAAGISGEAGEVIDIVKKNFAYGKPLDTAHLVEELGDLLFYINGMLWMIDCSWQDVLLRNIAKLESRYPEGSFSAARAINRDLAAEQAAMGAGNASAA